MLIDSPRITPRDRAVWDDRARYDAQLARALPLDRMAEHARAVIRGFADDGPCYASTSWGKDSTVVAHLVATSGVRLPLVYVRVAPWDNPDCDLVRDAFLAEHGDRVDYHEITVDGTNVARWWDEDVTGKAAHGPDEGFADANRRFGARHISGVRGEESRIRGMVMARWGDAGPGACRPIGRWTAVEVFAYLHLHGLPVHPAYAMSAGGGYDRRWLRVSTIGGVRGAEKHRADWERAYYADVIRDGRAACAS